MSPSVPSLNAVAFADARLMHEMALTCLQAGDVRDAAEKAWCATKRATDGLIIARTGTQPATSPDTTRALKQLAGDEQSVHLLLRRYRQVQSALHGDCFYLGACEPLDHTQRLIRGTGEYIADAEGLAAA